MRRGTGSLTQVKESPLANPSDKHTSSSASNKSWLKVVPVGNMFINRVPSRPRTSACDNQGIPGSPPGSCHCMAPPPGPQDGAELNTAP
jgi:hypothetical protein